MEGNIVADRGSDKRPALIALPSTSAAEGVAFSLRFHTVTARKATRTTRQDESAPVEE